MKKEPRILFTTAFRGRQHFDIMRMQTKDNLILSLTNLRYMQPGLRFIKQNIPIIEILEFPTWEKFVEVIKQGWDIVGFSFYTNETRQILEMADHARKAGVPEIWGGNYGVLNQSIALSFDKVFIGYSENQIAQQLGMEVRDVVHPPLIDNIGIKPIGSPFFIYGWLYTSRGCPLKCTFCQTPVFSNKVVRTPVDSIEKVLRYYKKYGVHHIFIYDENFGIAKKHTHDVVKLLGKYEIPWGAMTRADILKKNFDEWYSNGFVGAKIGIESMNSETLKDIRKQEKIEDSMEIIEILNRNNCYTLATLMIGFVEDTPESIKNNYKRLKDLKPDFVNLFILTPYHKTKLWDQIEEKYGIDQSDWSKFDSKHLVWNHPHLTPEDCQELLNYGYDIFNSEKYTLNLIRKFVHRKNDESGPLGVHNFFISSFYNRLHARSEAPIFFEQAQEIHAKKEMIAIQQG